MATNPIVVVDHGRVHIPEELKTDPRFQDGAHLELVPVSQVSFRTGQQAWEDFMNLEGILADSDYDPNAELEKEKQRELAKEAGWARS